MARPRVYASNAERQRAYRERRRQRTAPPAPKRERRAAGVDALVRWARRLKVPPGHPREGRPFRIMDWQQRFLADCLTAPETLLTCGRKNSKSALVAVLLLGHVVGPLRRPGFRSGVLSVSRLKAGELLAQIEAIATASGYTVGKPREACDIQIARSPWPGKITGTETGGTIEVEGAGHASASGHSAGYDFAIVDEIGLLQERHRPLINGMRSSVSTKGGRFVALSIVGSGPFVPETLERRGSRHLAVHEYAADPDLPIDSEDAWKQANPGYGVIKMPSYFREQIDRVLANPADEQDFVAHDLNRPGAVTGELLCSVAQWRDCEAAPDELPPRRGPAVLGIDVGDVASFTSCAAHWPESGRLEVWTACPDTPSLDKRARSDAAGSLYAVAHRDGHLWPLAGRLTPLRPFLERIRERLAGEHVAAVGADRRRAAELMQHVQDLALGWRPVWRGGGLRSVEDAAHDIRSFQRAVASGAIKTAPNVLIVYAIGHATVLRSGDGSPTGLKQSTVRRRIDTIQAAVIALGLAALRPRRQRGGRVSVA